jgi:predicted HAD superfamily Cof-like phosphohydrolase
MKTQQQQVTEFMLKARQECPANPILPSYEIRKLRAALILEEAVETINALGFEIKYSCHKDLVVLEEAFEPNLVQIADGCADLKVVTIGTEIACGINGEQTFNEVMRSNMTKFIDGTFRADGKYLKGPSYEKPRLKEILEAQEIKIGDYVRVVKTDYAKFQNQLGIVDSINLAAGGYSVELENGCIIFAEKVEKIPRKTKKDY